MTDRTRRRGAGDPGRTRAAVNKAHADLPGYSLIKCTRCRRWIAVHVIAGVLTRHGKGDASQVADLDTVATRCRRCRRLHFIDTLTGEVLRTVDDKLQG